MIVTIYVCILKSGEIRELCQHTLNITRKLETPCATHLERLKMIWSTDFAMQHRLAFAIERDLAIEREEAQLT